MIFASIFMLGMGIAGVVLNFYAEKPSMWVWWFCVVALFLAWLFMTLEAVVPAVP